VATGETVQAAEAEMREAIRFHIEGLKADGLPIPAPRTRLASRWRARKSTSPPPNSGVPEFGNISDRSRKHPTSGAGRGV